MNDVKSKIVELDLNDVLPNRFQPRIKFNEDSIIELSESIKAHGVLQPIIVRPIGDKYEIIAGERRYKACVLAGLSTIPSRIIDYNDKDSAEVALIENVQRKNLTPIEEAISYKKILDMGYLTQEQLASKLGMSQSAIANKKRLLNLCDEVQEALMEEKISERHARSLLKLSDANDQRVMLKRIIKERLTVRKVDEEITKLLNDKKIISNDQVVVDNDISNKIDLTIASTEVDSINEKQNVEVKTVSSVEDDLAIDITNLFKEDEIDNFLNSISNPKSNDVRSEEIKDLKIEKEETGEIDNMINDLQNQNFSAIPSSEEPTVTGGRFFNMGGFNNSDAPTSSSSSDFNNIGIAEQPTSSKIDDLMAPQGSSPVFQNQNSSNQENIFASMVPQTSTVSTVAPVPQADVTASVNQPTSMFSNLMNNTSTPAQDEFIDGETFNNFLDPSYIDGQKQVEPTNKQVIDSSVFAKFLDPDYELKEAEKTSAEVSNSQPSSMIFGQFNTDGVSPISEQPSAVESISSEMPSNDFINPVNSLFAQEESTPVNLMQPMMPTISEVDNTQVDVSIPSESSSNFINPVSSLFAQEESKPIDLIQPENPTFATSQFNPVDTVQPEVNNEVNNDEANTFVQTVPTEPVVSEAETMQNQFQAFGGMETPASKPDLLAPMSSDNTVAPDTLSSISPVSSLEPQTVLTPDASVNQVEENNLLQEESSPIQQTPEQPVFVMASSQTINDSMPSNPIIENPDMSKLLSVDNTPEVPVQPEETIVSPETSVSVSPTDTVPATIAENTSDDTSIQVPGPIGNQPIIITDYNKQYDPVLPTDNAPVEPSIDLRHVINMIRDLSSQIENYGYIIDTEEIDLQNTYQVIFNITKK